MYLEDFPGCCGFMILSDLFGSESKDPVRIKEAIKEGFEELYAFSSERKREAILVALTDEQKEQIKAIKKAGFKELGSVMTMHDAKYRIHLFGNSKVKLPAKGKKRVAREP